MSKLSKDFIKFRQYIRSLSLSINEQYLLELFFEYHNCEYGYCFLKFDDILKAFNTTSKNRISATIKSLETKGLVVVNRNHKNNRYSIVNVNDYIKGEKQVEKVYKDEIIEPLEGDIKIDKISSSIEDKRVQAVNNKITTGNASKQLIDIVTQRPIHEVNEVLNNIDNKFVTSRFLENAFAIKSINDSTCRKLRFNNYKQREYDYDDLEKKLLGW